MNLNDFKIYHQGWTFCYFRLVRFSVIITKQKRMHERFNFLYRTKNAKISTFLTKTKTPGLKRPLKRINVQPSLLPKVDDGRN